MPKITSKRIQRLHISLTETEYQAARNFAEKNNTSISEIIRICLNLLISNEIKETNYVNYENNKENNFQVPSDLRLD